MTKSVLFWMMSFAMTASAAESLSNVGVDTDPIHRPSLIAPLASHAVTLAVALAGSRAVAVGERGVVLWSDDGRAWHQAKVPVSVTLTALSFPTARQGWAVGHGGVVLRTTDGGETWVLQLDGRSAAQLELKSAQASGDAKRVTLAEQLVQDGPDKPFLAVHFWDAQRGFVIGAYGLIFGTENGGATWNSWIDRVPNPKGLHLNALYVAGETVFLAGEQGLLLKSTDGGRTFLPLASPYQGSWFAVTGFGNRVVVAGLRGSVFWSGDAGSSWSQSQVPVPVTIISALTTGSGEILFSNQAGNLLSSTDGGIQLHAVARPPGPPLTAFAEGADGSRFASSTAGAWRLSAPGTHRHP